MIFKTNRRHPLGIYDVYSWSPPKCSLWDGIRTLLAFSFSPGETFKTRHKFNLHGRFNLASQIMFYLVLQWSTHRFGPQNHYNGDVNKTFHGLLCILGTKIAGQLQKAFLTQALCIKSFKCVRASRSCLHV